MKRRLPLLGAIMTISAIAVIAGFVLTSGNQPASDAPGQPAAFTTPSPTQANSGAPDAFDPSASPEPGQTPRPPGLAFNRVIVPSLGIDAPIVTLGIDSYGTMLSPDNPVDVAWYDFSALPGQGSNVVLAGHLDYVNYGPAVFYRLKEAQAGEEVHLVLVDGSTARYRVLDVTSYDEATAPVQEIVGPTAREIVTLITCGGAFDPLAREYNKRVVLRAERILEAAQAN